MTSSIRRWLPRVVLALVAGYLVIGIGLHLSKRVAATRMIEVERSRVRDGIAAVRAKRVIQHAFFDPAEEGNSWELLNEGLQPFGDLSGDEKFILPTLREMFNPGAAQEDVTELLAKIEPQFEVLKRALRRSWVEPAYPYEEGFEMRAPLLNASITACYIIQDRAWARHEEGKSAEAVDFLILGFGVSHRVSVKGLVINHEARNSCNEILLERLKKILSDHRLDRRDLERLERALAAIHADREELIEAYRCDDLVRAAGFISIVDSGDIRRLPEPGRWRDGIRLSFFQRLSFRILGAEYFETSAAIDRRVESAVRLPLGDRLNRLDELDHELEGRTQNPLVAYLAQRGLWRLWLSQARDIQGMCLARLAISVALHREDSGEFPTSLEALVPGHLSTIPADELSGHPFAYSVKEGSAKVYSWDRDGDDDGGSALENGGLDLGRDVADGDVVWTVKRRS